MKETFIIAYKFNINGEIINIEKYGSGLINKTYSVETTKEKYILQQINNYVFKKIDLLMENIYIVTKYIKKKKGNSLELIKTKDNKLILNYKNKLYRCYKMKENSISYEELKSDQLALKVGKIISQFQYNLSGLNHNLINETIEYFHDLRHRYIDLVKAYRMCESFNKKKEVKKLFLKQLKQYNKIMFLPTLYQNNIIPKRICHYDTKLNNFLFVQDGQDCLIDLDTVMPGCSIYDFGDCARNIIVNVSEDDNKSEIKLNYKRFVYLTIGYLSVGKNYLYKVEIDNLINSIKVITLELSIRFLIDYLVGNLYFTIIDQKQNLRRALCQYHIYEKLLEEEENLNNITKTIYERLTIIN